MAFPRITLPLALAAVLGSSVAYATQPDDPVTVAGGPVAGVSAFAPLRSGRGADEAADDHTTPARRVAAAALAAVERAGGVPVSPTAACDPERAAVSYRKPARDWESGGFISPLGPVPTVRTTAVNGLVVCRGNAYGIVGFTAALVDGVWDVELVPDPAGGEDGEHANVRDTAPKPKPVTKRTPLAGLLDGKAIEGYARYEGQTTCDPAAKPGTTALRNLLLSRYPSTVSMGISRACGVGGRSEHKEGRAFDWGAYVTDAADRAAVESFIASLHATDSHGNRHALARRMGVMYLIWNHRIWSAYSANAGWRAYTGSSPHTDHMHISLSWAGARGQTSFWSGTVVPGLPDAPASYSGGSSTRSVTRVAWRERERAGDRDGDGSRERRRREDSDERSGDRERRWGRDRDRDRGDDDDDDRDRERRWSRDRDRDEDDDDGDRERRSSRDRDDDDDDGDRRQRRGRGDRDGERDRDRDRDRDGDRRGRRRR